MSYLYVVPGHYSAERGFNGVFFTEEQVEKAKEEGVELKLDDNTYYVYFSGVGKDEALKLAQKAIKSGRALWSDEEVKARVLKVEKVRGKYRTYAELKFGGEKFKASLTFDSRHEKLLGKAYKGLKKRAGSGLGKLVRDPLLYLAVGAAGAYTLVMALYNMDFEPVVSLARQYASLRGFELPQEISTSQMVSSFFTTSLGSYIGFKVLGKIYSGIKELIGGKDPVAQYIASRRVYSSPF